MTTTPYVNPNLAALSTVFAPLTQVGLTDVVAYGMGVAQVAEGKKPYLLKLQAQRPSGDVFGKLAQRLAGQPGVVMASLTDLRSATPKLVFQLAGSRASYEVNITPDAPSLVDLASHEVLPDYQIAVHSSGKAVVSKEHLNLLHAHHA